MIKLYDKDFTVEYGSINTICEAFVEEERNGLFELSFIMLNTDKLFSYVKEENIVVTNANDTLLNQKFRIYMTRKLMNNRVEVFARHISFDLMYDYIDNLSFTNQSCQYALNQLFINSNFSKHYKGYSDIVNAQDYKMSMANILEAIGGKSGSIIDSFGNGAEILRDNENIHVLNRRGNDNEVTIEYRKNITGFELEEDTTDLITRILPYAKYNEEETSEEITVKADYVDSPLINNYSHPYIKAIDYSEKFEDGEIPTTEKLINYAKREFNTNKVDTPKQNFKIDFIPLSKCVGYEGLEDKISLCDTVTIIDTRYNINTQAKVIKTVFNVLKNRYESIELGDPKTTLGDIVGSGGNNEPVVGPPGPQGPPGQDGNLGDFPNSLPATPILESFVYGFSNIELSWTFENKIYYQYELYASKVKDFTPNAFDLIFQGQASSYMFQAKPNETWYFKVCAINTYGERTEFSNQATVITTKIEDLSNYVENMAISEALIGTLSLDRGWIGRLNANLLDVKGNFSVTDGNGKRTLDIDSFGNVNLDVASLKISSKGVATQDYTNNIVNDAKNEAINSSNEYADSMKDEAIDNANSYTDNVASEAIDSANNYTDNVKNEIYASIDVTANGITSRVDGLDNKYTQIKQTVDNIDLTGKVSFTDLKNVNSKTVINGGNITAGTIRGINIISTNTDSEQRCAMLSDGMRFYSPAKQAGRICFDSNGEGTASSSKDRFLIESWNGYAMKLLSEGDLSITAKKNNTYNNVFLEANNVRLNNNLKVDGATELYSTLYTTGNITSNTSVTAPKIEATGNIVAGGDVLAKGQYKVYHTGSKPTASEIGALSTSGGTLSGALTVNGAIKGSNYITLQNSSIYLGYDGTTSYCDSLRLGWGLWVNKGSAFYAINTAGNPVPIYSSNVKTSYSVDEVETVSDISALDYIDNINVVNTSEGLRLITDVNMYSNNANNVITASVDENTNKINMSLDYNTVIATMWKAIQELKQENDTLKNIKRGGMINA